MEIEKLRSVSIDDIKNVYDNSTVHCVVITDSENKILYASQSLADALGYQLLELNGVEFSISPATNDKRVLENGIHTIIQEPSKKGYVVQKNGAKALVDYESLPVGNSDSGKLTLNRISNLEGYVQYNHLTECKETLENILDNLKSSIILINPELTVLKTNAIFTTTYSTPDPIPKNTTLSTLDSTFWQNENVLFHLTDSYKNDQFDFDSEFGWDKETGENKIFKIESRLIHKHKDKAGHKILLVITDITEEKANQSGRNQQIRHIMHELRNPLSNIALCVELLSDSIKENNQEDSAIFLSKAGNSIQRMKQLINDLNDFKKQPAN